MHRTRSLHCYEYLERPYDRVRQRFGEEMVSLLEGATANAAHRAQALSTLHGDLKLIDVAVPVQVRVHSFQQTAAEETHPSCRLEISWEAAKVPSLFPSMRADLVAHPVAPNETQLALFGTYRPPLGAVGSAADAVLGHRLAEASVHRFLRDLADRLLEQIAPPEPAPDA